MAVSGVNYLDKIVTTTPAMSIETLSNAQLSANILSLIERGSGEVLPNFIATQQQKPQISFTTPDLSTLLTNIGHAGGSIATGAFWIKAGATAGRAARDATSHRKVACTTAHIHWPSLRLPHMGKAELDVIINPIYDGTNEQFILTAASALVTTIGAQAFFRAGPCKINNSAIGAIQDITVTNNIQLVEAGGDGDIRNTFVGTMTVETVVEVRTLNMINWASGILISGTALDGSNGLQFWARKYAQDGQMVANATEEHVLFTALNGRVIPLDTQGQGSEILSDRFKVEVRGAMTIDTTAAIT